jgi:hypothetical protein
MHESGRTGTVYWDSGDSMFVVSADDDGDTIWLCEYPDKDFSVIGTIHDAKGAGQ